MTPMTYQAHAHEAEPGCWLVRFYDVPEAIAQGDTLEEAIANAPDALAAALEAYLEQDRPFPAASAVKAKDLAPGHHLIEAPVELAIAARALLAKAMADGRVTKVGLAKLMGRDEKVARRVLAGQGSLDLTLEALRVMGVRPALAA